MGYGEVGGGGSVQWQLCHDRRKMANPLLPPAFRTQQGEGIDPDAADGTYLFVVVNAGEIIAQGKGRVIVRVKLEKKDDVQLMWGVDVPKAVKELSEVAAALPSPGPLELPAIDSRV